VLSGRTTRSTISDSCERGSSLIVVRLIDLSEVDPDGVRLAGPLGDKLFPGWDMAVFCEVGLPLSVHVLLGGEWLYSGGLGSVSSLALLGSLVASLSLGWRAGSCCWP